MREEEIRIRALNACIEVSTEFSEDEIKDLEPECFIDVVRIGNEWHEQKKKEDRKKLKTFQI